jgi:hypothetical protein
VNELETSRNICLLLIGLHFKHIYSFLAPMLDIGVILLEALKSFLCRVMNLLNTVLILPGSPFHIDIDIDIERERHF